MQFCRPVLKTYSGRRQHRCHGFGTHQLCSHWSHFINLNERITHILFAPAPSIRPPDQQTHRSDDSVLMSAHVSTKLCIWHWSISQGGFNKACSRHWQATWSCDLCVGRHTLVTNSVSQHSAVLDSLVGLCFALSFCLFFLLQSIHVRFQNVGVRLTESSTNQYKDRDNQWSCSAASYSTASYTDAT